MKTVVSVGVMRKSDTDTIQGGISSRELMYRAGAAIYNAIDWKGKIAIVCGSGNNAGDGYALAMHLKEKCRLFLLEDRFSDDGRYYFDECVKMGVSYSFIDEDTVFDSFDMIVDCIFGTGFRGEAEGRIRRVIDRINESGRFVVSCDIPSGLNGDTGLGYSVVSDVTVSVGTLKTGLIINTAKDKIKRLINCPIGIEITGECHYLLEKEDFKGLIPKREHYSHKGKFGYTAVMGGCEEYSGAIKLANMSLSALKAGCGVNKIIIPDALKMAVMPYLLESTLFKMPDKEGKMCFDKDKLDEALMGVKALSVGMGWGRSDEYEKILEYILENYKLNVVIDADGLNTLAKMDMDILKKTECKICLTPHVKEFSRLSDAEVSEFDIYKARAFAKEYGVIVLLKGTATAVTDGEEIYLVNSGCGGMATGGSGDVLSGILCGLLGYMPFDKKTIALGAYIAGRAGEIAESRENAVSMTASDTVRAIGEAISELSDK